jgi:hypothetical protein
MNLRDRRDLLPNRPLQPDEPPELRSGHSPLNARLVGRTRNETELAHGCTCTHKKDLQHDHLSQDAKNAVGPLS